MRRMTLILVALLSGCMTGDEYTGEHDEPADFEVGTGDGKADEADATFSRHDVVSDAVFTDYTSMTVAEVQAFLEASPYDNTSWLATYQAGGKSTAQMIVDAGTNHRINPIILLARMQVEATLVSKTVPPTKARINAALGCGCHDGQACYSAYAGLANQLECGADTMRKWYDGSIDGTGLWVKSVPDRTLDPLTVTPTNHATASLYAYTPWVLVGRGGNWLVWNVTRKYVSHAREMGWIE